MSSLFCYFFAGSYLSKKRKVSLENVLDHIDYIKKIAGIDCIGIGSDFGGIISSTPEGLENISKFPNLTLGLLKRGYQENEIKKILGENFKRVFKKVWKN